MLIQQINDLLEQDKLVEALKIANSSNNIHDPVLILTKVKILIELGKIEEVLQYINEILDSKDSNHLLGVNLLTNKAFSLWRIGKTKEALNILDEAQKILNNIFEIDLEKLKGTEGALLIIRALIYSHTGKLDIAIELIQKSRDLIDPINNKWHYIYSQYVLGMAYWKIGKSEIAIETINIAIKEAESFNNKYLLYNSLIVLGNIYLEFDEFEKARQIYLRSLDLSKIIDNKLGISISSINLAEIHRRKGNNQKALSLLKNTLEILTEIGNTQNIALSIELMGLIYENQGKLDLAKEHHLESLQYRLKIGNKQDIAWSHKYLGIIYWKQENYYEALEHFKKCISIEEEIKNEIYISYTYFSIVLLCSDMGLPNVAEYYYEKLQQISEIKSNKIIQTQTLLAKGYFKKQGNRLVDKAESQQIFKKVANDDLVGLEHSHFALINLAESLIFELQLYGEKEVLLEVNKIADKILIYANKLESYSLVAQVYGLLANLSLIELKIEESKAFLNEGLKMAKKYELIHLENKLIKQQNKFINEIDKMSNLLASNTSVMERIELSEVFDYIKMLEKDTSLHSRS